MSTGSAVRRVAFLVLVITLHCFAGEGKKHYFNSNYNFCIDYPGSWQKAEPFDSNAVELFPPNVHGSTPRTEITVGGMVNQPSEKDETHGQTLDEVWHSGFETMSEYGKYTELSIVGKNQISFAGYPALRGSFEYTYEGHRWREEQILFITRSDAVFVLTLTSPSASSEKLTPIFDSVAGSFELRCNPRLPERP
jgi:hypothetical protein